MKTPLHELKVLDVDTVTKEYERIDKVGFTESNPTLQTAAELPAFSEFSKTLGKDALETLGDREKANAMAVGVVITSSLIWEILKA